MATYDIDARFLHMKDAIVTPRQYADGSLALTAEANDDDGFPEHETLSVNLTGWGVPEPPAEHIYVPTWSEHEGLVEALEAAGIATRTDERVYGSFNVHAVLMRVSPAVLFDRAEAR